MTEIQIRKKALERLTKQHWVSWYPPRVRWRKEQDIFGVFDLIAVKTGKVRFIQLTTWHNIRAREKKVKDFLTKNELYLHSEIWGWKEKEKNFGVIIINYDRTI